MNKELSPGGMRPPQRVSKKEKDEHERRTCPIVIGATICVNGSALRVAHRRGNKDEQDGNNLLVLMIDEATGNKDARMVEKKGQGSDGRDGVFGEGHERGVWDTLAETLED